MPITCVSVVYSAAQEVIRSITHFDRIADKNVRRGWRLLTPEEAENFDEEKAISTRLEILLPGEAHALIPHADYHAITSHQDIHVYLGLKGIAGQTDRHITVNHNGWISGVHLCDPIIDCPGGIWRNTEYRKRYAGHMLIHNLHANSGEVLGSK